MCQELQEFMTLSPKKIIQNVEESFIRVFIVIVIDVSSVQSVVDDECFNIVLCTEMLLLKMMKQHGGCL